MNILDLENNFFGRQSILDLLKRRVIDLKEGYRQNIAFIGDRYIGKSSILRKFMSDLDEDTVIEIYLDLEQKDIQYLFSKFIGSILYHYSKSKQLTLYDDINLLMENVKKLIPQTVEAMKKIQSQFQKGKIAEAYRDLISLPEIFTLESGKCCVIILDEFHHLEELMIPNVFQELGKKIMTQKKCLYLVISSLGGVAKKIISEKLSLLFGNFEIIHISSFDLKTSQAFLINNLKNITINSQLRNFLIDFSGGHPFYLNIISQEIVNLCAIHKQSEVFLPLLTEALENTIFNRWGILSRHFELIAYNLTGTKGNLAMQGILIALSNGRHKLKDICEVTKIGKNIISQKINRLIELGIVVKNGDFHYIQDKLLKYWIKYILQKKLKAIDISLEKQVADFKAEIHRLVAEFHVISQKDLSSRIVELLHCFDNESFQINGKRYKLPTCSEIVPLKFKSLSDSPVEVIKASTSEGVWFIVLKEDMLLEVDVSSFLSESRKLNLRPQRKVIVSLNELDVNARLRALQEKMWIWNEEELNTLLNLYDKPYIVK